MSNPMKYIKDLEAAGFQRNQAEAQVQMVLDAIEGDLVTKSDLAIFDERMERRLDQRFGEVDRRFSELERRLSSFEHRMEDLFSKFVNGVDKKFAEVDKKFAEVGHRIDKLELKILVKLGGYLTGVIALGFAVLAWLIKIH